MKNEWVIVADGSRAKILKRDGAVLKPVFPTTHIDEINVKIDKDAKKPGATRQASGFGNIYSPRQDSTVEDTDNGPCTLTHNSVTSSSTISDRKRECRSNNVIKRRRHTKLTDEIIETEERSCEFAIALHDHPNIGANALVDEF